MKNKNKPQIIFVIMIALIITGAAILMIAALTDSGDGNTAVPGEIGDGNTPDIFDANDVISREDPIIMTADGLPVKFSEFNYFYHEISYSIIDNLDYPDDSTDEQKINIIKNALNNGVEEGRSFEDTAFERTKEYCVKFSFYKRDYISLGYEINKSYEIFYKTNDESIKAESMEELQELNKRLLYTYGIVRNEYVDIKILTEFVNEYIELLGKTAKLEEYNASIEKKVTKGEINVIIDADVAAEIKIPELLEQYK